MKSLLSPLHLPHTSRARFVMLLPYFALVILGLFIFSDYGAGVDEDTETHHVFQNYQLVANYYAKGDFDHIYQHMGWDSEFYGTLFNFVAYPAQLYFANGNIDSAPSLEAKHLITFLLSSLTFLAIGAALWRLTGSRGALIAAIAVLTLNPYFFGTSFFLPKDAAFSTLMTLGSLAIALAIGRLTPVFHTHVKSTAPPISQKRLLLTVGILIGMCASIRVGGLILMIHAAFAAFLLLHPLKNKHFFHYLLGGLTIGITAFLVVWLLHPAAWPNPFKWLWDAATFHAHHQTTGQSFLDGKYIKGTKTPLGYLPHWFFFQTPIGWQLLTLFGMVMAFFNWKRFLPTQKAILIIFTLQAFSLPLIAIGLDSNLYAGFRQFVFVIPALALFGGYALIRLWQLNRQWLRLALVAYATLIAADMISLHPYQQDYVNGVSRENATQRWHLDYNINTPKATAEWLNENAPKNSGIHTNYGQWLLQRYLRPDLKADFDHNNLKNRPYIYSVASVGGTNRLQHGSNCGRPHYELQRAIFGQVLTLVRINKCR